MTRSSSLRSWLMTSIAPGKRGQLGREPTLGGEVEMVGGLVEHEGVGLPEQDPDDVDPPALPARQRVDVVEQGVLAEPDPLGEAGDVALEVVARRRPRSALRGRRTWRWPRWSGPPPRPVRAVCSSSSRTSRPRAESTWEKPVGSSPSPPAVGHLGQEADGSLDVHVPRDAQVREGLAADDRDQRRLPRPVAADQPDLVVGPDHERRVAKQGPATDLDGEVAARDHRSIASGW